MSSDIKLEDNEVLIDGEITIDGDINLKNNVASFKGYDLVLDSELRRGNDNESVPRRALVHDHEDGLTINYNKSYPNGVTVHGPLVIRDHLGFSDDAKLYVGGSATFNQAPYVPDLRIAGIEAPLRINESTTAPPTNLASESLTSFGSLTNFITADNLIPSPAASSLVDVIKDLQERIKALEDAI